MSMDVHFDIITCSLPKFFYHGRLIRLAYREASPPPPILVSEAYCIRLMLMMETVKKETVQTFDGVSSCGSFEVNESNQMRPPNNIVLR